MRLIICSTIAFLALAGPAGAGQQSDPCEHHADRSTNMDAAGVRLLELAAGSGSLKIEGMAGLTRVILRGKACASNADLLEDIQLDTRRTGSTIVVRANVRYQQDPGGRRNWRENTYARLDLVIEVPAGLAADIEDGSGHIDLSYLGAVRIEDGSGDIVANHLASARIEDGSGNIRLVDIAGAVDIEDGSGEIHLSNIGGAIEIEDGSGEIEIRTARNNVRITDSSGSISVRDVDGDFTVDADGSGGIDYANVRGRMNIPNRKRR